MGLKLNPVPATQSVITACSIMQRAFTVVRSINWKHRKVKYGHACCMKLICKLLVVGFIIISSQCSTCVLLPWTWKQNKQNTTKPKITPPPSPPPPATTKNSRITKNYNNNNNIDNNNYFIATHMIHEDNSSYDGPFNASMEIDTCENDIQVFYVASSS